ncbi:MAG: hypothetical protein PVG14_19165, partial [Anaerolineales bacterium]
LESFSGLRIIAGVLLVVYASAQAVLVLGFAKHALRMDEIWEGVERWVWIIYPLGLGVLPLTHFGLAWWTGLGIFDTISSPIPFSWVPGWWGGLLSMGLLGGVILWIRRSPALSQIVDVPMGWVFSFEWLYRFLWWIYRTISRVVAIIDRVLEGDGGLLWALLIITLLLSFLSTRNGGG